MSDRLKEVSNFYDDVHRVLDFPDHSVTSHRQENFQVACQDIIDFTGIKDGQRIIDAGCGLGSLSLYLAKEMNVDVKSITISAVEHAKANERLHRSELKGQVEFFQGDFHQLDKIVPPADYDLIIFNESFEHAFNKEKALRACGLLLAKGKRVYLKYHVKLKPANFVDFIKFKIAEMREIKHLRIYQHVTLQELENIAQKVGFKVVASGIPQYDFTDYDISNDLVAQANEKVPNFNFIPVNISFTQCTNILLEKC